MIHIENLKVAFDSGDERKIVALNLDSLTVQNGSWCNIIGPNGSGKSTLINALSGEISSTEMINGKITLAGNDVSFWDSKQFYKLVQVVEQNPHKNLVLSMTIRENLWMYSSNRPWYSLSGFHKKDDSIIIELLSRFRMDLENRLDTQVGLLSGGQRQAVALACVLSRSPGILLLDEFLASIDPNTAPVLLNVVREISEENSITVLAVSHDLDQVVASGDRIILLAAGRIVYDIDTKAESVSKRELVSKYTSILERDGVL